jgi:hypothetical protein
MAGSLVAKPRRGSSSSEDWDLKLDGRDEQTGEEEDEYGRAGDAMRSGWVSRPAVVESVRGRAGRDRGERS